MSVSTKGNVVCAIVKNEAKYILEWIAYHRLIGFDFFFLYDHESEDDTWKVVSESPFSSIVKLNRWSERPGQLSAYKHFISTYSSSCKWVAFIDVDEFIFTVNNIDLGTFLERKSGFSAILINWLIFGASQHISSPKGLVIENYLHRLVESAPGNRHVKTIAKCSDLLDVTDTPHLFAVSGKTCDSNGSPVSPSPLITDAVFDEVVINHYFTKSKEDWDKKLRRGKADTGDDSNLQYKQEMFYHVQTESTTLDDRITRFSSLVNSLLSAKAGGR